MNSLTSKTFTAQATIGLYKGYTSELITLKEFKTALLSVQKMVDNELEIKLSTKITLCEIVFLGQEEQSVTLDFIQYPKFPIEEEKLKQAILFLVEKLMLTLQQNRVTIIFLTETIMLEQCNEIDPRVKL